MLTPGKIWLYRRFNGDIDGLARAGINDSTGEVLDDWRLIDELRQALFLIWSGRAAPEFTISIEQRLAAVTADEETRQALRELGRIAPYETIPAPHDLGAGHPRRVD